MRDLVAELGDANNPRGAARGARLWSRCCCGRPGPRAHQPTLAHDIAAVAPTCHVLCDAAKLALAARSSTATLLGTRTWWRRASAASSPARTKNLEVWRDGACERTIQGGDLISRRCCRRGLPLRRCTVKQDTRRPPSAPSGPVGTFIRNRGVARRRSLRGIVGGTARSDVPRRRYARPHLQVHTRGSSRSHHGDGQHIISGSDDTRQGGASAQEPCGIPAAAHRSFARRRCPTASSSSAVGRRPSAWPSTAPRTLELHGASQASALPDNQHALSASDDKTVKLFNVNGGTVRAPSSTTAGLPGAAARRPPSSAARTTTRLHVDTASRRSRVKRQSSLTSQAHHCTSVSTGTARAFLRNHHPVPRAVALLRSWCATRAAYFLAASSASCVPCSTARPRSPRSCAR